MTHRQHDQLLWASAATIGALSGCRIEGGEPCDVPSTASTISPENGLEGNGLSGRGIDANGRSFSSAVASSHSPAEHHRKLGDPAPLFTAS